MSRSLYVVSPDRRALFIRRNLASQYLASQRMYFIKYIKGTTFVIYNCGLRTFFSRIRDRESRACVANGVISILLACRAPSRPLQLAAHVRATVPPSKTRAHELGLAQTLVHVYKLGYGLESLESRTRSSYA